MPTTLTAIDDRVREFIESQHVFFVATAPSGADGHVNVSPKGIDGLRVLDSRTLAYLDYVGGGVETIAHLRQNGRIVIMVCAFEGAPRVIRVHGQGVVIEPGDVEFDTAVRRLGKTPDTHGLRSVIRVAVERVGDSRGYGVPNYVYQGPRTQLDPWASHKDPSEIRDYQRRRNASSIDGLPGLHWTDPTE